MQPFGLTKLVGVFFELFQVAEDFIRPCVEACPHPLFRGMCVVAPTALVGIILVSATYCLERS